MTAHVGAIQSAAEFADDVEHREERIGETVGKIETTRLELSNAVKSEDFYQATLHKEELVKLESRLRRLELLPKKPDGSLSPSPSRGGEEDPKPMTQAKESSFESVALNMDQVSRQTGRSFETTTQKADSTQDPRLEETRPLGPGTPAVVLMNEGLEELTRYIEENPQSERRIQAELRDVSLLSRGPRD